MSSKLAGVRVIDAGTRIAAPFCAGLLGEQGAEVVKVEQPREGDFLRVLGPFVHDDYSLFWAVEGRGRKSVTCDLRQPEGQELFRRLCAHADVLVENFRPGTLEHWNVGPADLDPRLVIVRCTIFGQDGPYAARPGLDRIGMSYGGVMYLTGYADRPPVRTGVTIADYLTGVFAAEAAVAALYDRDARGSGKGSVIDVAQYEAVLRTLEWTIPGYELTGEIRERSGNRLAHAAPMDNFVASDGKYVCITAGAEANFERLCKAMGRPELADDPRFATPGDRAEHGVEINDIVAEWVMGQTTDEAVSACVKSGVRRAPRCTRRTRRDRRSDRGPAPPASAAPPLRRRTAGRADRRAAPRRAQRRRVVRPRRPLGRRARRLPVARRHLRPRSFRSSPWRFEKCAAFCCISAGGSGNKTGPRSRLGNSTVPRPGVVTSSRWFVMRVSMST